MRQWFRGFVERLAFRLMSVLSAKIEAQLEMELADVRADLLERSRELGCQTTPGLTAIAASLTESSTRIGQSGYLPAAAEQSALDRLEQDQHERHGEQIGRNGTSVSTGNSISRSAGSPQKRARGRPPKSTEKGPLGLTTDDSAKTDAESMRCSDGQ